MRTWKSSLIEHFKAAEKSAGASLLGVEIEHFILERDTQAAVAYSGEKGVREILSRLMERYPEAEELPDDDFFGFRVPDFTITLEPAAQLEISIAPMESVAEIERIYSGFLEKLKDVLSAFGYTAVNTGCQPVSRVESLEMIPKRRYDLMNAHFRQFGTGGMEMMRGSASLQVSVDYRSEQDFRRKIQAAYFYGPVLKLLCDNAACFQGEVLRSFLKRTDIWRRVDPSRCGILPNVFSETYGYGDYADFLGAMPPIFLKQDKHILPTGSRTVAELYDGKEMRAEEITHILSMAFPDVRLKQFLELRFADSVPLPFIPAYCALLKGLLYAEEGLAFAARQIRRNHITEREVWQAETALMEQGWRADVYGQPVRQLAEALLELAGRSLSQDEREFLNAFLPVTEAGGIRNIPRETMQKRFEKGV